MRTIPRHPSLPLILLSIIVIQIAGCETVKITTTADPAPQSSTPKPVNRMFWGLINNKIGIADPIFPYSGIQVVNVSTTTPQAIAAILTLGIYCPINYSYRLALTPLHDTRHSVSKYNNSSTRRQIYDTNATGCHDIKFYTAGFTHDTVFHKPIIVKNVAWGLINSLNKNDAIPNSKYNGGVQSLDIRMTFWERVAALFSLGAYREVTYTYKFAYLEDEYY
jgi:hypothetical protein